MPAALYVNTTTVHGQPLAPGPGSTTVFIGDQPAWRSLPAGVGGGLEKAAEAVKEMMDSPQLTPPQVVPKLPVIQADFAASAGQSAAQCNNPAAISGVASAFTTLMTSHTALAATWASAQPTPGAAAATTAYTQAVKAALASAASAAVTAIAGAMDMSTCAVPGAVPPHGPGLVTNGSETVFIDDLPASHMGHQAFEAAGGAVDVTVAAPTVFFDE